MKKIISCAVICAAAFGAGVLICPAPASGAAHDITAISRQAGAPEQNGQTGTAVITKTDSP